MIALYVFAFLASGALVVYAGVALSRHADAIAAATGISRIWAGAILLASATSLPELATDLSAVRLHAVDLAVGDLFGSSMANMLILALIDLIPKPRRVLKSCAIDHALSGSLAIVLNGIAVACVMQAPQWSWYGVSPFSVLIVVIYLGGARVMFRHEPQSPLQAPPATIDIAPAMSLRRAIRGFVLAALGVVMAGPVFAWAAHEVARVSGLGDTFVGTLLVGLATSLPELVTSLAAVRMGAFDLAVGNLFGSNALNMVLLLPMDLAQPGSLFAALHHAHAMSGLMAMVLMALGLSAIIYRSKRRLWVVEPDSVLMLLAYVAGMWLLYVHATGG
jgi:cation:H+ antiporter